MPQLQDDLQAQRGAEWEGAGRRLALLRGVWGLYTAGFTLVGVILAGPLGDWLAIYLTRWVGEQTDLTYFLLGLRLLCGLIGLLVALKSFNWLVDTVTQLERLPLLDKAAAVVGVLLGLTVAILATVPFAEMGPAGLSVRVLAAIILVPACVFFALSAKDQLVYVFPSLARPQMHLSPHTLPPGAKVLDTNVIIDGRVADIAAAGFLEGPLLVPGFVLNELRTIADSSDDLRRARGRRGLEILNRLRKMPGVTVLIYDDYPPDDDPTEDVDSRLVKLAKARNAAIITNDHNVGEMAKLMGVRVLNINELAQALRPQFIAGEELVVTIVREGKEAGQGVAYLEDGTMVVVEGAAKYIGHEVPVVVTNSIQTSAGKMIFADLNLGKAVQAAEKHRSGNDNGKRGRGQ